MRLFTAIILGAALYLVPQPASAQIGEYCAANPGICAEIIRRAWDYFQTTTEGECWNLSTEFEGKIHHGSQQRCITIRGKVRNFLNDPSQSRAKDLLEKTGSDRTSFYASAFMGCVGWGDFLYVSGIPEKSFRWKYACDSE